MKTVINVGGSSDSTYASLPRNINDAFPGKGTDFDAYFLANRTIASSRTSSLLVSASFGANSILYAAWLGYVMGLWALLIHAAWCSSFLLLAKFAPRIYRYTSLHDFLGCKFGRTTQIVASSCSIIGLLYFAGWEIAIAKSGIESLIVETGMNVGFNWPLIISITVLVALLYTTVGGQKANGHVDFALNNVKFLLLGIVVFALGRGILSSANVRDVVLLPNISSAIGSIGIVGFVTNMLFNASWQFVDNSSWQSISSGSRTEMDGAKKSLISASKGVFISYLGGTTLGVFLRVVPNLNSDNILGGIASSGIDSTGVVLGAVVLLLLSMVSLIDGVGLSVAQSLLVDLKIGGKSKKLTGYSIARILTVAVGAFAAWGIQLILDAFGKSTFDFVYIFIVAQLSLLGPVIVGLIFKNAKSRHIWVSIIIGITTGIGASIVGGIFGFALLSEAAGTISAVSSTFIALLIVFSKKKLLGKKAISD